MPSFDIVSEVNLQEVDNALNQSRKELVTRFDFRGSKAEIQFDEKTHKILLTAEDASRVASLNEIVIGKLAKRNIDLRNVIREDVDVSSTGQAKQEFTLKMGIEGDKAKEIIKYVKDSKIKVQCSLQERQIRVTGKNRDDLQEAIQLLKAKDFEVSLGFENFRN